MKRLLGILIILAVIGITITDAQVGPNTPFEPPTPSSSTGQTGQTSPSPGGQNSAFGGGGINPNDIDPPPDPIDTPFDAGVIFLLIIGTAYGVTKVKREPIKI